MRINDVVIDANATLGSGLLLTEVIPVYAYLDGKRTDTIVAYKYVLAMSERGFDKIAVKIAGPKQVESPVDDTPMVELEGLQVFVYYLNGKYNLGARATAISLC